ncbi:MAG: class I tRNA ligase family protein, partial [Pseudonocardiales bacterium]|nr:class I tRNA ligase family protein [Pseudonocardiales bacterium]
SLELDPGELAAQCNHDIRETLKLAHVDIDAFTTPDENYRARVQEFFTGLYRQGKLARRIWTFPYCPQSGRFLLEAFVSGYCPECLAYTCGAICESCGHPNDVDSLLFGAGTGVSLGAATEQRDVEILVLPLEEYRERFTRFYTRRRSTMRPRVLHFVDEMLAQPLPDFPVSYPADWGILVPFDGFVGQVFNVWAEMLPGLTHMAEAARKSRAPESAEDVWAKDSGYELVQFLGYDNTFYFSLAHLGLILSHGGMIEPTAIITNEFCHLDGAKFSTSRRHLIWARDLIVKYGADNVRFYLALNNPEHQSSNFTEAEFLKTVETRLRGPLTVIDDALTTYAGTSSVDSSANALLARYRDRMLRAYTLETFSLRQAAESTANLLGLLATRAASDPALAVHGLRVIAELAAPLLPGLAEELQTRLGRTRARAASGKQEEAGPW